MANHSGGCDTNQHIIYDVTAKRYDIQWFNNGNTIIYDYRLWTICSYQPKTLKTLERLFECSNNDCRLTIKVRWSEKLGKWVVTDINMHDTPNKIIHAQSHHERYTPTNIQSANIGNTSSTTSQTHHKSFELYIEPKENRYLESKENINIEPTENIYIGSADNRYALFRGFARKCLILLPLDLLKLFITFFTDVIEEQVTGAALQWLKYPKSKKIIFPCFKLNDLTFIWNIAYCSSGFNLCLYCTKESLVSSDVIYYQLQLTLCCSEITGNRKELLVVTPGIWHITSIKFGEIQNISDIQTIIFQCDAKIIKSKYVTKETRDIWYRFKNNVLSMKCPVHENGIFIWTKTIKSGTDVIGHCKKCNDAKLSDHVIVPSEILRELDFD
eukprot:69570_1